MDRGAFALRLFLTPKSYQRTKRMTAVLNENKSPRQACSEPCKCMEIVVQLVFCTAMIDTTMYYFNVITLKATNNRI